MAKREIITIDEDLCNGCGLCVPNCHEGALQIVDNKARLISDLFCDGLGACVGHCPQNAITVEMKEAEAYDEKLTMKERIVPAGPNTIKAHLEHLRDHKATEFFNQGIEYLKENNIPNPLDEVSEPAEEKTFCGCPGSQTMDFSEDKKSEDVEESGKRTSQLQQWPVQLHLVSPQAPYFQNADVLIAADCTAFAVADFHKDFLKGKALAIACPKLDSNMDVYVDKITSMIDHSNVNTLTVMIMQVPCCGGLSHLVKEAANNATRKVPVKEIVVSLQGEVLSENWL